MYLLIGMSSAKEAIQKNRDENIALILKNKVIL
mgnify:CR=1 FL=1